MGEHGCRAFDIVLHNGLPNVGGAWAPQPAKPPWPLMPPNWPLNFWWPKGPLSPRFNYPKLKMGSLGTLFKPHLSPVNATEVPQQFQVLAWCPSSSSVFKINSDASLMTNSSKGGIGYIANDHRGHSYLTVSKPSSFGPSFFSGLPFDQS
ncbi:hypothetical protein NE237_030453 [Protea cynaroides]|uniref:Uncharacterized protein n=1 Tax=Protea cynaroides TaxID=273540 RepID=A0A9Q0GV48_9MAGN|nr:hypothetical protein NE237_030453 [Protea cynaroides]